MQQKTYQSLELHKILSQVAQLACCSEAKEQIMGTQPSTELAVVRREVQKTYDALSLSLRFGSPSFYDVHNPDADIKLCQAGGCLSPKQLLNVASVLRQVRLLKEWHAHCENVQTTLDPEFSCLVSHKQLEDTIVGTVLSEDTIADTASDALFSIRRKIRNTQNSIREKIEKITKSQSYQKYLQDNIVTIRDGRFVVLVKAEYRNEVSGLVHDSSSSGATLFIEPMAVVEANNEIRVLQSKEQEEIERILFALSADCAAAGGVITGGFESIVSLNIYFSKANYAAKIGGNLPSITDNGIICLNKARHPLIDPAQVVPISVELGVDYTSLIVTGPNTGGKTVTLKTIGLLTLMAMCGLLIPVGDDSSVSVFEKVLVDIGDEQSIEQSLSTFSAHMKNIISILEQAGCRSLVLLDELGSGTDPVEGAALAAAVLEQLRQKHCIVAATTHYAELKMYALQTDGVQNASCEFDVETLKPTYRLIVGAPGRSNAFAISQKLGLSSQIIEQAQQRISTEDRRFEDVVDALERARLEHETKANEFDLRNRELELLRKDLKTSNKELLRKKEAEIERARQQARQLVETVQAQAHALVDELEQIRKQKDKQDFSQMASRAKSQLKGKLNALYDLADPVTGKITDDHYVLPRPLKPGDTVAVLDIDKKGTVMQKADKSGNILVQVGIMKMRVKPENLRLTEDKNKVQFKGKTTRSIRSNADRQVKAEVDLRGLMVEEALLELDRYIDDCVLSNLPTINIIHGKGTGTLRTAVHQHLRKHQSIRTYRLGVYGEGETGVTIAELK